MFYEFFIKNKHIPLLNIIPTVGMIPLLFDDYFSSNFA